QLTALSALPRAIARLSQPKRLKLGRGIGRILGASMKKRNHIMDCNIAIAFPELDQHARKALIKSHWQRLGEGICEGFWGWFGDHSQVPEYEIIGREHLEQARQQGQGVILNAAHVTDMELGVYFVARHYPVHAVYRPNNHPVLDVLINSGRIPHLAGLIPRNNTRAMVKALRAGEVLWTAPDQNYHGKTSAFIPFFGRQAATNTAVPMLARLGRAVVLPYQVRRDQQRYQLIVEPPVATTLKPDDTDYTRSLVLQLEREISKCPASYLWGHKRFKTQPPEYKNPYQ
ncbi:MAG TPA: lipid A biosynthesis acyltransferase, partial [Halothiobacillaceae bacterium]|nr:lipid A biosynthesis acyltransferase [Halothiobacillaceae bacterium]